MSKTVLMMAGGTGGHIFPALVVAKQLQQQGYQVEWLGSVNGMEQTLVGDQFPFHSVNVTSLRGNNLLKRLLAPSVFLNHFIKRGASFVDYDGGSDWHGRFCLRPWRLSCRTYPYTIIFTRTKYRTRPNQ